MAKTKSSLAELIWLISRFKRNTELSQADCFSRNEAMNRMYECKYKNLLNEKIQKLNNDDNFQSNPPEFEQNYSSDPSENFYLNMLNLQLGNRILCNEVNPNKISIFSKNYACCAKIRVEHTYIIEIGGDKKTFKRERDARNYLEDNGILFD